MLRGGAAALGPSEQPREAAALGAASWESLRTLYLIAGAEGALVAWWGRDQWEEKGVALEDPKCRGYGGGSRTCWGPGLEALARRTTWAIEEGVDVSGMGCSGKEGSSHKSGVDLWMVLRGILFTVALLFGNTKVLMVSVRVLGTLSLGEFNLHYRTAQGLF